VPVNRCAFHALVYAAGSEKTGIRRCDSPERVQPLISSLRRCRRDRFYPPPARQQSNGFRGLTDASRRTALRARAKATFPLSIHKASGQWCKRIRGRVVYFGRIVDDPKGTAAVEVYQRDRADLEAGREPRRCIAGPTLADFAHAFLAAKAALRDNGELSPSHGYPPHLLRSVRARRPL
jgi:hypothetical protein